jgi:hypothetical protein
MRGLTPDDLLSLDEYTSRRREFFAAHARYVDRYRRVRLGPRLTLVFENRQTLWFRLHEVVRVARLTEPKWLQLELTVYNRLLPGPDRLQAALLLRVEDEVGVETAFAAWRELRGEDLCLHLGARRCPANLHTCRPEDRCLGAAHLVQFVLDAGDRQALADPRQMATLAVTLPGYRYESAPLTEDIRESLLEDLRLSDRDVG